MRLEIQTSTLPHHVLSALVNFTCDERHPNNGGCRNEWISSTLHPWSSVSSKVLFPGTFNPPLPVCLLFSETEVDNNKPQVNTLLRRTFSWGPYIFSWIGENLHLGSEKFSSQEKVFNLGFLTSLPVTWKDPEESGQLEEKPAFSRIHRKAETTQNKNPILPPSKDYSTFFLHYRKPITGSGQPIRWVKMPIGSYCIWAQFTRPPDL